MILIPTPDFPHFYYMLGGNLGSLLYGDVSVMIITGTAPYRSNAKSLLLKGGTRIGAKTIRRFLCDDVAIVFHFSPCMQHGEKWKTMAISSQRNLLIVVAPIRVPPLKCTSIFLIMKLCQF